MNLLKGDQTQREYLALNPQGRVPALVVDATTLIQSPAILEYLEETYPTPPLLPSSAGARAQVRAACALIACDIHPLNNVGVLRYLKRQLGLDQPKIDNWYRHWVIKGFATLEHLLQPGPFAFGAQPTLGDVYLIPQVYNARSLDVSLQSYPKIAEVDAHCREIPAFAEASPERQPDAV